MTRDVRLAQMEIGDVPEGRDARTWVMAERVSQESKSHVKTACIYDYLEAGSFDGMSEFEKRRLCMSLVSPNDKLGWVFVSERLIPLHTEEQSE